MGAGRNIIPRTFDPIYAGTSRIGNHPAAARLGDEEGFEANRSGIAAAAGPVNRRASLAYRFNRLT